MWKSSAVLGKRILKAGSNPALCPCGRVLWKAQAQRVPTTNTHEDWRVELPSDAVTESAQSDQQSSAVLVNAQADAQP